ncbi:MAG: carboxypeptidase regulatory-like domain-containing protein [Verrucomicrobia bacterium]|nr:carboxypeptidase regulatory-like domain-containing protein [Verrucomicrobiota bacterium]MDA1065967.1 carboxypeptidase regulatory-like domain-containing protein [Verrucomicrobiota bacterium]
MPIPLHHLIGLQNIALVCLNLFVLNCQVGGQDLAEIVDRIEAIEKQNNRLIQHVSDQQVIIDNLRKQLIGINEATDRQNVHIVELQESAFDIPSAPPRQSLGSSIHISGEAGVIFRVGEANTNFPNEEFRVDEARVFIEAQIAEKIYLFSELELFSRESNNSDLEIGELYIEFEEVLAIGDWDRAVNFRMGRLDIPFSEEYLKRDVMDNPLISHSVADFWGIDEGIEAFGELGDFSYVLAVMNGSHDRLRDFTSDKSVVARAGFDLTNQLHFGGSFMRTGEIDPEDEFLTELWFGNGFFRSIGSTSTTRFEVELAQLESTFAWQNGEIVWQNSDEIFHNVFSISEAKPFDLGYYKSKDNPKAVVFVKPGRVDVFCSIHSQMNCIVLVMPNPWFATSDRRGNYEIKNVPPGTYQLKAWHERLPPKYLEITVPEEGTIELDIVMGLSELPKF